MTDNVILYSIIIVLVIAVLTFAARLFPFALFGRGKEVPSIVRYLGDTLPPSVMILLIIYCIRNVDFLEFPYGLPQFAAIALTFILYKLTKNNLIAIICGTALFMVLIRVM